MHDDWGDRSAAAWSNGRIRPTSKAFNSCYVNYEKDVILLHVGLYFTTSCSNVTCFAAFNLRKLLTLLRKSTVTTLRNKRTLRVKNIRSWFLDFKVDSKLLCQSIYWKLKYCVVLLIKIYMFKGDSEVLEKISTELWCRFLRA